MKIAEKAKSKTLAKAFPKDCLPPYRTHVFLPRPGAGGSLSPGGVRDRHRRVSLTQSDNEVVTPAALKDYVHKNEHMFGNTNALSRTSFLVLRFLGRNYHQGFYVREIARLLHLGVGTASEILARLSEAGLLHREERGRLVLYQAAMKNPLLREIKICATLIDINPLVLQLQGKATRAILFGSAATGEDTDESDIDLFIETRDVPGVAESIAAVQAGLDREISAIILTPGEFRSLKTTDRVLYERIIGGKTLHEEYDEVSV
jgi:predicted nucleotidyltransferase